MNLTFAFDFHWCKWVLAKARLGGAWERVGGGAPAGIWLTTESAAVVGNGVVSTLSGVGTLWNVAFKHPKTGVPFDKDGYPDFRAAGVVKAEVKIKFTGDPKKDYAAAYEAANIKEPVKDYTWHHHQDGTTMQLVPSQIHRATGHTGGMAHFRKQP